ncbi:MAG: hypothetical protein VX899_20300 [Myxococcota bacterium]|nr:hypothetical protein [Myxococcota bacterium]
MGTQQRAWARWIGALLLLGLTLLAWVSGRDGPPTAPTSEDTLAPLPGAPRSFEPVAALARLASWRGAVTVQVVDSTGAPQPGVSLRVRPYWEDERARPTPAEGATDEQGRWRFTSGPGLVFVEPEPPFIAASGSQVEVGLGRTRAQLVVERACPGRVVLVDTHGQEVELPFMLRSITGGHISQHPDADGFLADRPCGEVRLSAGEGGAPLGVFYVHDDQDLRVVVPEPATEILQLVDSKGDPVAGSIDCAHRCLETQVLGPGRVRLSSRRSWTRVDVAYQGLRYSRRVRIAGGVTELLADPGRPVQVVLLQDASLEQLSCAQTPCTGGPETYACRCPAGATQISGLLDAASRAWPLSPGQDTLLIDPRAASAVGQWKGEVPCTAYLYTGGTLGRAWCSQDGQVHVEAHAEQVSVVISAAGERQTLNLALELQPGERLELGDLHPESRSVEVWVEGPADLAGAVVRSPQAGVAVLDEAHYAVLPALQAGVQSLELELARDAWSPPVTATLPIVDGQVIWRITPSALWGPQSP